MIIFFSEAQHREARPSLDENDKRILLCLRESLGNLMDKFPYCFDTTNHAFFQSVSTDTSTEFDARVRCKPESENPGHINVFMLQPRLLLSLANSWL